MTQPTDNTNDTQGNEALDTLLSDLAYDHHSIPHPAPTGLSQRILAALPATPPTVPRLTDVLPILLPPWRALTAAAMPLLLGVVLGSTSTEELPYPEDDELLVLANLSDTLPSELTLNFAPALSEASQ